MTRILALTLSTAVLIGTAVSASAAPPAPADYSPDLQRRIVAAISPASPPIRIHLQTTPGLKPVVSATTNLPDGSILQVMVKKPWLPNGQERLAAGLAACGDNCLPPGAAPGQFGDRVAVKDGAFRAGPFTYSGAPLPPGSYPIEITLETGDMSSPAALFHKVYVGRLDVH